MYYIGVDIGGMSMKVGLVDASGNILVKDSVETKAQSHYSQTIKDLADLILSIIDRAKIDLAQIKGIGIGIPGTIDSKKGIIVYANNINFEKVPIVKELQKYIKLPVMIGNDANCAALGEVVFGSAKGQKDAVFVTLGTGVGSGIIIDGKIFEGKGGAGAEAGHSLLRIGGEQCTCGRKGCWEAYASATALIRQTQKMSEKYPDSLLAKYIKEEGKVSGRTAFKAAKEQDKPSMHVVKQYIRYIGEGLVNLVNIFRPEVLIIGGGISNEGDYLIERLQRFVTRNSYGGKRNPHVKVVAASLKNDAGILGGVALLI